MADHNMQPQKIDLAEVRRRLSQRGKDVWSGLGDLAQTEEFRAFLQDEFPRQARGMGTLSRRDFLKLMAAPLALAGLTSCAPQPLEKIMPYAEAPEGWVAGRATLFATAISRDGYALGVLAESHEGRPTKLEGNPNHPASLGATDAMTQGALLTLYDPERARQVRTSDHVASWGDFEQFVAELDPGTRLRILTGTVTSPTLGAQLLAILDRFGQARWHRWDAVGEDTVRQGALLAFGEPTHTRYAFEPANVILSLDSNFLFEEPGSVCYAREFSNRRDVDPGATGSAQMEMNRLYVVESEMTITGAMADHRLALPPSQVEAAAQALAFRLGVAGIGEAQTAVPAEWLEAVVEDLQANRGASLVIPGRRQTPAVHALAHAINAVLGNVGQTVLYSDPVDYGPEDGPGSLADLVQDLQGGQVDVLLILEGNPVYAAPADLNFGEAMTKAGTSIYYSLYDDETAEQATWLLPATHFLEMWSDARAFDGTASIIQPLIEPLYESHSPHELAGAFVGDTRPGYDIVRGFWQDTLGEAGFDSAWRKMLADGIVENTLAEPRAAAAGDVAAALAAVQAPATQPGGLELAFAPDYALWDGRYANSAWLQELPRPITLLSWDNAALMSATTAQRLGVSNDDVVELRLDGRSVRAPVWVMPGQAENTVTVHLGYGRRRGGTIMAGAGFNAFALRSSGNPKFATGLEVQPTGETYHLVTVQDHHSMEGREIIHHATLAEFREHPEMFLQEVHGTTAGEGTEAGHTGQEPPPSLYPEVEYNGYAWGMSINLTTCIGCNACTIACQAENNIPVVGKKQVDTGREMLWLLVDRYFQGEDLDHPAEVMFQPRPCMHCETAPCEPVCPVAATVHSSEGINEMVYNRCVGTRYCSNNCPYKVRRFNFLQFANDDLLPVKMVHNPEVTVRSRGVMEKCTYCVQRINSARADARANGRRIGAREVQTACQQVCPVNAIVFGDINNPEEPVVQLKERPHSYGLLAELGTQPRTTYLARLRNPNPKLASENV